MEMIQGLNKNDIIIMVANDMSFIPYFSEPFAKHYSEHRIELYERASIHKNYNSEWFSNKRLCSEISMKRIFAVLLSAEENQETFDFVCSLIENYPNMKSIIAALKSNDLNKGIELLGKELYERKNNNLTKNIFISLFYYYFQTRKFNNEKINSKNTPIFIAINEMVKNRVKSNYTDYKTSIEKVKIHEKVKIIRECRKVFESWNCGDDLLKLDDLGNIFIYNKRKIFLNNGDDKEFQDALTPELKELLYIDYQGYNGFYDIYKSCHLLHMISSQLSLYGFSLSAMIEDMPLTKEDKDIIAKNIANTHSNFSDDKVVPVYERIELNHYVLGTVSYLITKMLNETRTFYFQNNSESEFFELSRYIKENKMLSDDLIETREKVSTLLQENDTLNQLYNDLQTSISTTENNNEHFKKLENSYFKEIELLKSKISSLEGTIKENENERQELYRLRELAFDIQHNDIELPNHKPLEELLEGKKVILIGGHINIRNKLIEKYPALTILDGHNPNIEESLIMNADLVIFNTSNMSHKVYEKIIKVLRTHEGKFDYVGRVMNMEKLDNEIAALIEKNL